jgi:hypothetical protein
MSPLRSALALLLISLLGTGPSPAQQADVPTQRLAEPEAVFGEPFSSIAGLRELSDGRVIISDRLEAAIRLIDFSSGAARELGHVGEGPGEFKTPGDLLPLPGDSTLLVDFGNMRMSVIAPDGSLAMESESLMRPEGFFLRPAAADAQGRLYFDTQGLIMMSRGAARSEPSDSSVIARWDRRSGAVDTVGRLAERRPEGGTLKVSGGGGSMSFSGGAAPFAPVDAWDVAADGRVAIARADDYHIEWHSRDGSVLSGPTVAYEPVKVTREDKEAWADRLSGATVSIATSSGGNRGGGSFNLPRPDIDEMEWPASKPPFPRGAVAVTPEGEVWVQRFVRHGAPETYDVFDGSGRRVRRVVLAEDRQLVGFGRGAVYVARRDNDDLRWLERHSR